jgi:signal transduction histidine kinase
VKWFDDTIGRRLAVRLYFYLAILLVGVLGTTIFVGRRVVEPAMHEARREGLAWVAEDLLTQRDSPELVRHRIAALHERLGVKLALFGADGRLIADSGPTIAEPLNDHTLAGLAAEGTVTLSPHLFAVGQIENGRLAAYVIVDWRSLLPPVWKGVAVLALAALALLWLSSLVLARAIARPLERLARVTQAFGLGDLRARASTARKDEIGDLGRAFNQMADRVESLRRAEKELLANVSHELRTPLARIRVVVELAAGSDPQPTQRYLSEIAEDLTEVEQLLGDIITAARLDLSDQHVRDPYPPLRLTPARLGSLVDGLVRRFREAHPDRVIRSTIEEDTTVALDRVMLKHAISNVLDNAHKYSPGGRPIEIELRIVQAADGPAAVVKVRDHGSGIDPADVPHVFTAFFRADRSRTRSTGGVGLGLTLARRIVEAHGGTIDLKSQPGKGTTVSIALPLRSALEELPA